MTAWLQLYKHAVAFTEQLKSSGAFVVFFYVFFFSLCMGQLIAGSSRLPKHLVCDSHIYCTEVPSTSKGAVCITKPLTAFMIELFELLY